jgi:hypothetical protein
MSARRRLKPTTSAWEMLTNREILERKASPEVRLASRSGND